jgi:hypothetical protein
MSPDFSDQLDEMLGPLPDISGIDHHSRSQIFGTAFELYKYTAKTVGVVANCISEQVGYYSRDQAILVGLLIRITKFMAAVMQLSDGQRDKARSYLRAESVDHGVCCQHPVSCRPERTSVLLAVCAIQSRARTGTVRLDSAEHSAARRKYAANRAEDVGVD